MGFESNFMIDLSILYRNMQKFFDKVLSKFDIGSGQLLFLFFINENEGISMQEASRIGELDKGTTTKSIQKLIEQGYVTSRTDENDRRVKRLYTTSKAAEIMGTLYEYRNEYRSQLATDVDFAHFESLLGKICDNSRKFGGEEEKKFCGMKIGGMQKLTLLDFPGKAAATIFTCGCNYKCPFCHNKDLVFVPGNYQYFEAGEVLAFLNKRKGLLDGVCISGGEPLMQEGLLDFVKEIKEMGYLVKLDTNGNYPNRLKAICETGLIDYVAMDIKNTPAKYAMTAGVNENIFRLENIQESIDYLMNGTIEYEFRTTVVRELHTKEDLVETAKWIKGAKKYYLQQYVDSGNIIQPNWTAYNAEEMKDLQKAVAEIIPTVELRGVKEG